MPYKSAAQRGYFHANRARLEAQGINVSEWDSASKGMKLPARAKASGGAVDSSLRIARKYAEGGAEVTPPDEWENVPRSPEGRPQITVTPPVRTMKEGAGPSAYEAVNPANTIAAPKEELLSPFDILHKKTPELTPYQSTQKVEPNQPDWADYGVSGAKLATTIAGALPFPGAKAAQAVKGASNVAEHLAPNLITKAAEKLAPQAEWKVPDFLDTAGFQKIGNQKGTMPGGVFADPKTNEKFYLKQAPSLEQAKTEKLAAELYKLVGIPVADVKITQLNGKPAIASKMIEGQQLFSHMANHFVDEYGKLNGLHEGFPIDAWLANWDAPGTGPENPMGNMIVGKDGLVHRIDTGGSLYHKGTGGLKPKGSFGDQVGELSTMRDQNYSQINAEVYGNLDESAAMVGAQKLANVDEKAISQLVELYGPKDRLEKLNLLSTLLKRKQNIQDHYGVKPGGEIPKPTEQPRPEPRLNQPKDFDAPEIPEEWHVGELPDGFNDPIAEPSWMKAHKEQQKPSEPPSAVGALVEQGLLHPAAKHIWDMAKNGDMAEAIKAKNSVPFKQKSEVNKILWALKNQEKAAWANKLGDELFGKPKIVTKETLKPGPSSHNPKIESFKPQPHGWGNAAKYAPLDANNLVKAAHGDTKFIANELYKLSKDSETYADEVYKKLNLMKSDLEEVLGHWNDIEKAKGPVGPNTKTEAITALFKQDNPKGIDYASTHLKPIEDWSGWKPPTPGYTKPYFPSKMKEMMAENQGYNPNFEIHKGGEFYNSHPEYPEYPNEINHPESYKKTEPAWFGSDQAGVSQYYGKYTGGTYIARGKVFEVDWPEMTGGDKSWHPSAMHNAILAAKAKGADMLIVHRMSDMGSGNQTQYAVLNPAILRSPKANFNPALMNKSWPLAGLAGGGLFTYDAAKDDKMNRGGVPALLHRVKSFAKGGPPSPIKAEYAPWDINQGAHWRIKNPPMAHIPHNGGMIKSSIPGRTDKIPLSVKAGSYIVPADIPSALGQGNTEAGAQILGKMFKTGPYGSGATGKVSSSRGSHPRLNLGSLRTGKADGGEVEGEQRVPIIAAGGEMVIPPDVVTDLGHGNIEAGHKALDAFTLLVRKNHIKQLKSLKPPKGS